MKQIRRVIQWSVFAVFLGGFLALSPVRADLFFGWLTRIQFFPALLRLSPVVIIIIILTFLGGRIYCSTVCPLATIQDICIGQKKRFSFRRPGMMIRYTVPLIAFIILLSGFPSLASLFDPYSSTGRIITTINDNLIIPVLNLTALVLRQFSVYIEAPAIRFRGSILFGAVLVFSIIFLMSRERGRLFCNSLCPVGAILSVPARWALFSIRIDQSRCTACGACENVCKAEAIDSASRQIDTSRCIACFNCLPSCKFDALKFALMKTPRLEEKTPDPNEGRRSFLKQSAMGFLLLSSAPLWANPGRSAVTGRKINVAVPPGAGNISSFLSKCSACSLCISRCPGNVLQPAAFSQYGFTGLGIPFMDFNQGACEYDCTLCTTLCPSGAINPLSVIEKQTVKIGEARFVEDFCVVRTDGTSCGACGEICPSGAIDMVHIGDGINGALELPVIDGSYCIGCGACQFVCPVTAKNAIFVEAFENHRTASLREKSGKPEPEGTDNSFAF